MSNRNATASWSGFSHQGKIGILIALERINDEKLIDDNLVLDYEQQEDVRLKHNDETIEVHQVKALGRGAKYSSYTKALKNFEACNGGNYLHTIVEIENWNDLTDEENPKNVERYKYRNGNYYCGLDEISDLINDEIQTLLYSNDHAEAKNQNYANIIKNNLLGELDDVLRLAHHNKDYKPNFPLERINEIVTTNPDTTKSKLFSIRQRFYSVYEKYIADIEDLGHEVTDDHLIKMSDLISKIYCLDNDGFEQFLRNMNPYTTSGKSINDSVTTDNFFSRSSFLNVFMEVLQNVTNSILKLDVYFIPKYYKNGKHVLTSIDESNSRQKIVAREIIKNPDIDFSKYEADYLITEELDGSILEAANNLIDDDSGKFDNPKNLKFINKNTAITKLNS